MKGFLLTLVFLGCSFSMVLSQEKKMKRANKEYKSLAFIDANEIYLDVAKKGYRSAELLSRLGNTYYFNARYEEAEKWYSELIKGYPDSYENIYLLRYAQSLKASGKNEEAASYYNQYRERLGETSKEIKTAADYRAIIEENSGRYTMESWSGNSKGIDFGSSVHDGKLYFASTRDTGTVLKKTNSWDGLPFLDIYSASISEGKIEKIQGEVNSSLHENSAVITKDGKTMYFTRTDKKKDRKKGKDELQQLKIYRAKNIDGEWKEIEDLSINGENFSTAHPALSPSEDKLYFTSNRPESIGATDIFMAAINPDGSMGRVENLGATINTKGRESFPFVSERNELYFSSDGHFGLGGYDVFYSKITSNGFLPLINVGKPVNSETDDFAFFINTDTKKGYFSSNRPGGKGYDDIYSFVENKDILELFIIEASGTVYDKATGETIGGATVSVLDTDLNVQKQVTTDANGEYTMEIDNRLANTIRASKENYDTEEAIVENLGTKVTNDFYLERNAFDVLPGDDLAKMLGIETIYFDFDESKIRPDAEVELQKIVTVLNKYPRLTIDVRSHTDSRGNDGYNKELSNRRAEATKKYIIEKGISANRVSGRGYGETELLNNCGNNSNCSADQHQLNRRSEFIVNQLGE
ncbi:OmpA family protein [Galbibacter mesophilus]|uniref:OmpA family protein n=1 Tax=Galbibacter mesophilus TaxID=379069 RepID=UPI00191DFA32|nr:OmpA family protein [Galbibacter mesophilus]MCM5663862.1 OmpA family protein [Galbibacter mesophilus]